MRKKRIINSLLGVIAMSMMTGCGKKEEISTGVVPEETIEEAIPEEEAADPGPMQSEMADEEAAMTEAYSAVVDKYVKAVSENWEMDKLMDEDMSILCVYAYDAEGDYPIGFAPYDLDGDGTYELLIGSRTDDEYTAPIVFDAYAMQDGKCVQLFCSSERNRYYLIENEDGTKLISNEGSGSAAVSCNFYYKYENQEMKVVDGVLFDATVDEDNPCFRVTDDSWDASKGEPMSNADANALIADYSARYVTMGYISADQGFFIPDPEIDIPDPMGTYGSLKEMVDMLPSGAAYAYVNVKGLDKECLLVAENAYDNLDGNMASIEAMVYIEQDGQTRNIGSCYSSGTAYPIRMKDGYICTAGNHDVSINAVSEETGGVMVVKYCYESFDENGNASYTGFIRESNSFEAPEEEIDTTSDEQFNKIFAEYMDAEIVNYTIKK